MKRMNIDVGNDWASILEPAPTGMAKEEARARGRLIAQALTNFQASNYFKTYTNMFCLSYVIAQHNRNVRRACYIDMKNDFIPAHINSTINAQLINQFMNHQDGNQSHFPIQTLSVPLAVNAIGDIILKYYDSTIPTFNYKGHAGMHDSYLVADMPPKETLQAQYGSLGSRIHEVFQRLYSVQAQHYAQLQARIGVRMSIKLLLQSLSENIITKGKNKGQKKAITPFKHMEDFTKKQEERLNRFCNAYSLYLLVTNYHGVRLSELMVGVLDNSIPTSPSILNARLHIKMGIIATTTAIPKRIRKFVYKEGCDINEKTNIAINSKDAEGMHPSVFPEDSAYCPNDENGEPKYHPYQLLRNSILSQDAPFQDFMLCPVEVLNYK
jgi:hypothetical protein